jgi:flagellin
MDEFLAVINDGVSGVEATSFVEATANKSGDGVLSSGESFDVSLTLNDGTVSSFSVIETGSIDELVAGINEKSEGLVKASINDEGRLVLTAEDAATMTITDDSGSDDASGFTSTTFGASVSLTDTEGATEIKVDYTATGASLAADAQLLGIDERLEGGDITGSAAAATTNSTDDGDLTINGVVLDGFDNSEDYDGNGTGGEGTAEIVAYLNSYSAETGVVASVSSNVLTLNSVDGSEISLDYRTSAASTVETLLGMQETNAASSFGNAVADIDISTAAGAQAAIEVIDVALEQINTTRGDLGAINNRLDFTINNLSNVAENASASRSRIEDADFAAESAALSRAQVLQQAGTAMLAQANAAPQQVLSLLQ